MELQKYWQSSTNIAGEQGFPLKDFFLIFINTFDLKMPTAVKN